MGRGWRQGVATEPTSLAWVNHRVRKGEPEPLRWVGLGTVRGMYATYRAADRREAVSRRGESSRLARLADRVAGRH